MDAHRVLGRGGAPPWHLPADLKRFKKLTSGHAMVMGRRTWESIGRPLPRRRSIVLTGKPDFAADGAEVARGLEEALGLAGGDDEVFVIGGASVFAEALPRADRIYLTRVHARVGGDVVCPPLVDGDWELIEEERHDADERHAYPFSFQIWERRP